MTLDWSAGINRADIRRILAEMAIQRLDLLAEWRPVHGVVREKPSVGPQADAAFI